MTIKAAGIDWDNQFLMARLATAAVADRTGWIDANDPRRRIPTGDFVRARMYMQQNAVQVVGWSDGRQQPVAVYAGWERLPDFGPVFVGLVGSHANLVEVQTDPSLTRAGRTASDVNGLYELIAATREARSNDPEPEESYLNQERQHINDRDAVALSLAADSFRGTALRGVSQLVEVLFRVHRSESNVDLAVTGEDGETLPPFTVALLGAPVWVGKPAAPYNSDLLPSGRRAYQRMGRPAVETAWTSQLPLARAPEPGSVAHLAMMGSRAPSPTDRDHVDVVGPAGAAAESFAVFDRWLDAYAAVRDAAQRENSLAYWPPSTDEAWGSYLMWTVDQAARFANAPWPLPNRVRVSRRWQPRKQYDWDRNSIFGWIVAPQPIDPLRSRYDLSYHAYALTTDRRVLRCSIDGLLHDGDADPVTHESPDAPLVCASLLRAVARWRMPFEGGHHEAEPDVDGDGRVYWPETTYRRRR